MDQASKEMLKRDLLLQGFLLKWQEKVVPSANNLTDALPDLVLRDYNQQVIPVGIRVNLNFRWKDKTITAPAYIRAERYRGEPCLLGTNVVISLGLMVPDPDLEVRGNGFRKQRGVSVGVCLVGAVRVPGRSTVCVKGLVQGEIPRKTLVFEPDVRQLSDEGMEMEVSLVEADENGMVNLVTQNHGEVTRKLSAGNFLGRLESGCEVEEAAGDEDVEGCVKVVQSESEQDDKAMRKRELVQMIDICRGASVEEARKVRKCVLQAEDVFAVGKRELGEVAEVCHTVDTGDSPPVRQLPRQVPYVLRSEITRMVDDMLQAGVVQESSSPWASPIVLVRKKDSTLCFCVDYCRLNAITRKDVYPLPCIDDLLV